MASDSQTATYQVAVALTQDECKNYREPPEDMILMKITDTGKVVKAYKPFQDNIAKTRCGETIIKCANGWCDTGTTGCDKGNHTGHDV